MAGADGAVELAEGVVVGDVEGVEDVVEVGAEGVEDVVEAGAEGVEVSTAGVELVDDVAGEVIVEGVEAVVAAGADGAGGAVTRERHAETAMPRPGRRRQHRGHTDSRDRTAAPGRHAWGEQLGQVRSGHAAKTTVRHAIRAAQRERGGQGRVEGRSAAEPCPLG